MSKQTTINTESLPLYREWKRELGDSSLTLFDFIYSRGSLDLAIAFSQLFYPEVVIVNGCYFRREALFKTQVSIKQNLSLAEKQEIETFVNHLHVYDLFAIEHPDYSLEMDEYIGLILQKSWSCALKQQVPNINFDVRYKTEPEAYGPTLTFFQSG